MRILSFLILVFLSGCAGTSSHPNGAADGAPQKGSPISLAELRTAKRLPELWQRRLDGYATDLNLTSDAKALLVATIPNPDRPGGARKNYLSYFSRAGKRLWRKEIKTGVKGQALSSDGSFAVVTSYDDSMRGFDRTGRLLWTVAASCRPLVLNQAKRVICYHDDDSEPTIAFEVYDWSGKKLLDHPITHDILTLKVSSDESYLAIGLAGGEVQIFKLPDFQVTADFQVGGEIVDFDVESTRVAVLKKHAVSLWDIEGKKKTEASVSIFGDQIEIAPDSVYVYGNANEGQVLARYDMPSLRESWRKSLGGNARYTPTMFISSAGPIIGFEDDSGGTRKNYLLGFDSSGKISWSAPINADEGEYLYTESYVSGFLSAATDDGRIAVFKLP